MTAEIPTVEIAIGCALQLLVTSLLSSWGRWVARRRGNGRFWRFAQWTPWFSFALLAVGMVVGVVELVRAFGATATVDASKKAAMLAQNISDAMNVSAVFYVLGYGLLFFGLVTFVVGSLRPY